MTKFQKGVQTIPVNKNAWCYLQEFNGTPSIWERVLGVLAQIFFFCVDPNFSVENYF
jgi:hypothetical protein